MGERSEAQDANAQRSLASIVRRALNGDPYNRLRVIQLFVQAVENGRPIPPGVLEVLADMLKGVKTVDFENTRTRGPQLVRAMGLNIRRNKDYERDQWIENEFGLLTELLGGYSERAAILEIERERQKKKDVDESDYDGVVRRVLRKRGLIGGNRNSD